jgi:hypothetical protein
MKIRMLLNEVLPEGTSQQELPFTKEALKAASVPLTSLGDLQFLSIWECNGGLELVCLLVMLLTFFHLFLADVAMMRHDLEEETKMWKNEK